MPQIFRLSARDVMQKDVATLSADDTLETALALFEEARIGGAPVIDAERRLVYHWYEGTRGLLLVEVDEVGEVGGLHLAVKSVAGRR